MLAFDEMTAFTTVAQTRSFSVAARRLNLSQPAVSRRVARLERAMGLPLLERTSAYVDLTPAGRALLEPIQDLLDGRDRLLTYRQRVRPSADHSPASRHPTRSNSPSPVDSSGRARQAAPVPASDCELATRA